MAAPRQAPDPKDVFLGTLGWCQLVEIGLRLVLTTDLALPQHRALYYHVAIADRFHVLVAVQT